MSIRYRGPVACLLAAVTLAAVSACSSGSSSSANSSPANQTYAFLTANNSNPYFHLAYCGAVDEGKALGVKVAWQGPTGVDLQSLESALSSVVAEKPAAVLLNPLSPTALIATSKQASSMGIPTFTWDATQNSDFISNFRTDDVQAGKFAADYLGKQLNGKGTVEVQGDISGNPVLAERVDGFKQELAAKYPDVKVLPTQYNQGNSNVDASSTVSLAQANPDLNAVYTASNDDLPGVVSGLRSLKPQRKVTIVAWDADPTTLADLKSGVIAALIVQNPRGEAAAALKAAYDYVNGKVDKSKVPAEQLLPVTVVTKANMDDPKVSLLWKSC